jgi:hypothetical protein
MDKISCKGNQMYRQHISRIVILIEGNIATTID